MKQVFHYIYFTTVFIAIVMTGCKKDEIKTPAPVITINSDFKNIEAINEEDTLTIPVHVSSAAGIKRLAYYLINYTSNGTTSTDPVLIDRTDAPAELNENIDLVIKRNFKELVIIAFDIEHNNSEEHISIAKIRKLPEINFKDNIKGRESVFQGKRLAIEGTINTEYELASFTYQTIIEGVTSPEIPVIYEGTDNIPFSFNVDVVHELSAIIINSENIHQGFTTDTFRIGSVQDDAVVFSFADNKNPIEKLYTTVNNTFNGTVFSGTDMNSFTYSIKQNGIYGEEIPLTIGSPADEFTFSFDLMGERSIEAVRVMGTNEGGKSSSVEFKVGKVYNPLKEFKNIVLTTEIGPGKNNFFSAYQAPHVFSVENAAPYDEMIDIGYFKYTASSSNIMPPGVFIAGPAYASALAPYMTGFDKAAYTLVTANRPSVNSVSYDTLKWDIQMLEHIENRVVAPTAQGGENYNIYTTNRRTNNTLNVGQGFYIGWGSWEPISNQAFGIVIVRDHVDHKNGFFTVTLDIKVPMDDQRTRFNPESLFNYPQ